MDRLRTNHTKRKTTKGSIQTRTKRAKNNSTTKTTAINKTTTDEEAVVAEATVEVAKKTRVKEGINSMKMVVEGEEAEEEVEVDVEVINNTKEEVINSYKSKTPTILSMSKSRSLTVMLVIQEARALTNKPLP